MRKLLVVLVAFAGCVLASAQQKAPNDIYVVVTDKMPTNAQLQQLRALGPIHYAYKTLPAVAINVPPNRLTELNALPFVRAVYADAEVQQDGHVDSRPHIEDTYNLDLIDALSSDVTVGGTEYTGAGVYVAVLDTGLIQDWSLYLDPARVATQYGINFIGPVANVNYNLWQHDTNSHGTAVAATVIGYKLDDDSAEGGFLPAPLTGDPNARVWVRGVAPGATIIPVKVLNQNGSGFFSSIVAGIDYITFLTQQSAFAGKRIVINMSLGGGSPFVPLEMAINNAIAHGIVVVASAGNSGEAGMGWPGAYPQVLSAGAVGWTHEFDQPASGVLPNPPDNTWWFTGNPAETTASEVFVVSFSSRERDSRAARFRCLGNVVCDQDLDVLAPGRRVLLPFLCTSFTCAGVPQPPADPKPPNANVPSRYQFISGTSFSAPHVAGVAALLLQANSALSASQVETALENTALAVPDNGLFQEVSASFASFLTNRWDINCGTTATPDPCDPVGHGLVRTNLALQAVHP
ncbi:MAG: S8 family serine peptidase [Terriglobales bacterium]